MVGIFLRKIVNMRGALMNRKDTTRFLSELLICGRFSGMGKYWAKEVSVDYGTKDVKRVDFMQFEPAGTTSTGAIEKGIFTCYEVKSCKEDVFSGNGLNFLGEKNYIVTTMECWKNIQADMRNGELDAHITKCSPSSSHYYGIMVAIPLLSEAEDEYMNPTPLEQDCQWKLVVVLPCRMGPRKRSITEMLFYMVRSGKE